MGMKIKSCCNLAVSNQDSRLFIRVLRQFLNQKAVVKIQANLVLMVVK